MSRQFLWQEEDEDICNRCLHRVCEEEQIDTTIKYSTDDVIFFFICTTCPACYNDLFEEAKRKTFTITSNY